MPDARRRHSILPRTTRPTPSLLTSLTKKQGRTYEVYQTLLRIMDTPYDALVALMLWYQSEGKTEQEH